MSPRWSMSSPARIVDDFRTVGDLALERIRELRETEERCERYRHALEKITTLPKVEMQACDAANEAIRIAKEALK